MNEKEMRLELKAIINLKIRELAQQMADQTLIYREVVTSQEEKDIFARAFKERCGETWTK